MEGGNLEKQGSTLFSIGYGSRKIDDFISLLKKYGIQFLADLRSKPYSKYNPDFSHKRLESILSANGIKYVLMGDSLGGLPSDKSCYTDNYVDYQKVEKKDFYQKGLMRLLAANKQKIPLAIMCSEGKPQDCHRSKLIGVTLEKHQVELQHIDEKGHLLSQEQVISKIRDNQISFFEENNFTSRKKYISP